MDCDDAFFPVAADPLNFGVSTLEEIRLREALKAGYSGRSGMTSASGDNENIQSFFQPHPYDAGDGKE